MMMGANQMAEQHQSFKTANGQSVPLTDLLGIFHITKDNYYLWARRFYMGEKDQKNCVYNRHNTNRAHCFLMAHFVLLCACNYGNNGLRFLNLC